MQKILFLYGPSCAGKSTIANEIMKHENFFHVHYDRVKWFISDYHRDNEVHCSLIFEIMMLQIEKSFQKGFSILIEGLSLELFEKVKKKYEPRSKVFSIKVIADKKILINRFKERLERAKHSKKKISNKSLDVFLELYEKYRNEPELGTTIDTSKISVAETLDQVNEILKD